MLASASLVLLMTPALAFFYGGTARAKHTLAMLMQNSSAIAIVSVTWVRDRICPGPSAAPTSSSAIPHYLLNAPHHRRGAHPGQRPDHTDLWSFVAFQLTFAIITPALITGSTADR